MSFESLVTTVAEKDLKIFLRNQQIIKLTKNKIIFEQKSLASGVYCVLKGTLKRFIVGLDNKECIFDICGPGDIFGHRNIFTNDENFDSTVSLTDVELVFIPKNDFKLLLSENPVAMVNYIRIISEESIRHIKHGQVLSQLSLRQRMAFYLLYILKKSNKTEQLIIEISRDDLANLLGTVKESAVRTLQEFKQDGAITSSGRKIHIVRADLLMKVSHVSAELS
jgi:CRP-like cAMP-binding protein